MGTLNKDRKTKVKPKTKAKTKARAKTAVKKKTAAPKKPAKKTVATSKLTSKTTKTREKSPSAIKRKTASTIKPKVTKRKSPAKKYGEATKNEIEKEMHRFKRGTAHSGPKLKPVKNRKQAIAIALSKARKKGAKVPKKTTE